jgi:hypothetical protein
VGEDVSFALTEGQRALVDFVATANLPRTEDVASHLKITQKAAGNRVQRLKMLGQVDCLKLGHTWIWCIASMREVMAIDIAERNRRESQQRHKAAMKRKAVYNRERKLEKIERETAVSWEERPMVRRVLMPGQYKPLGNVGVNSVFSLR